MCTKKWPNLTFTSCPNRKSKLNIFKQIISQQPQEVNSQNLVCTYCYRSLIYSIISVFNCIFNKKVTPIPWPHVLPGPNFGMYIHIEYLKRNHISYIPEDRKFTNVAPLYRSYNSQKMSLQKMWPDLYLLLLDQTGSQSSTIEKSKSLHIPQQPQRLSTIQHILCTIVTRSLKLGMYLEHNKYLQTCVVTPMMTFTSDVQLPISQSLNILKKSYLNNRKR